MLREPFAAITRKQRWRARLERARRRLTRPLRPTRIDPGRSGPPHLLLLGIDTLRFDHLGLAGYPRPTSPHLDRLAAEGVSFDRTMAPAPWTLPSFASALCGVAPGLHGALLRGTVRNMDTQPPERLPETTVTLARHLAAHGYRTAAFYSNQFFAFGLAESFQHHAYHNLPAADLAEVAADWIRRHADRPFFCFVLFNDPHEPTTPPAGDLERFWPAPGQSGGAPTITPEAGLAWWGQDPAGVGPLHLGRCVPPLTAEAEAVLAAKLAVYDAAIASTDRAVGRLRDRLERWGLAGSTVLAAFADHGEEFLDHVAEARRWDHDPRDLRGIGHGHTHFEELLHVPWLAAGPGLPAGERCTDPVSLCDLAPTLTDWLDLPPLPLPETPVAGLVGRSQADRWRGNRPAVPDGGDGGTGGSAGGRAGGRGDGPERTLLAEAIAFGPDLVAVRRGIWKLIATRAGEPLGLYDLEEDPGERRDLAQEQPEILAQLTTHLAAWRAAVDAGGPTEGGSWEDLSAEVRQRLHDLGYAE